jgi:hypothetical protein
MGYRKKSLAKLSGAEASHQQRKFRPRARDILISWTRAREYRESEASYLRLARTTSNLEVRNRYVAIAQHYHSLAQIEQSIADQRPNTRRAELPFIPDGAFSSGA